MLRHVEGQAPEDTEAEREHRPERVQRAPRAMPGEREDRGVQHREPREQERRLATLT